MIWKFISGAWEHYYEFIQDKILSILRHKTLPTKSYQIGALYLQILGETGTPGEQQISSIIRSMFHPRSSLLTAVG